MNLSWTDRMPWDFVVQQTIQVTIVALVVSLLVRSLATDRPHLAHSLWALVLLKCITPPVIALPTSPFSWLGSSAMVAQESGNMWERQAAVTLDATGLDAGSNTPGGFDRLSTASPVVEVQRETPSPLDQTIHVDDENADDPSRRFPVPWRHGLLVTWVASSVVSLLCVAIRLCRFLTTVRRTSLGPDQPSVKQLSSTLHRVAREVGLRRGQADRVRVRVIDWHIGPAVVGLWRPTVLMPRAIVEESSTAELELLLAHELIHIRRGDLAWATLQTLATSLWWFHPLVRSSARWFDRESERCCDEETIASMGCHRATYARSLLSVLERKHQLQVAPALPGVRPMEITQKRMDRIMRLGNGIHARSPWWSGWVLLIGGALCLPGATWVAAQDGKAESKPLQGLPLPTIQRDAASTPVFPKLYDLGETLAKTRQGRDRNAAVLEIEQFIQAAVQRSRLASEQRTHPSVSDQEDAAVLPPDTSITITEQGELSVRGPREVHEIVRGELDRLNQFGTAKLLIETHLISIPSDLLKDLDVDWVLMQDRGVNAAGINIPVGTGTALATVSADGLSNDHFPVLTAQVSGETQQRLIESIHQHPKSKLLMCPTVAMLGGTEAAIRDSVQRPFVVGMQRLEDGDKTAEQPVVRIIPSGTSLYFRPELQDDRVTLGCTVELAQIDDVGTFRFRRGGQKAGEGTTLQVPRVSGTRFECTATDMPINHTFAIATPKPGMIDEVMIVLVTVQIDSSTDAALTPAIEKAWKLAKKTAAKRDQPYDRVPIVGPATLKGSETSQAAPSDAEVLSALQKLPTGKEVLESAKGNATLETRIIKEKIADYVDPPKFVPLLGDSQLHHAHYKCTVYFEASNDRDSQTEIKPRVIYIDHQHYQLLGSQ